MKDACYDHEAKKSSFSFVFDFSNQTLFKQYMFSGCWTLLLLLLLITILCKEQMHGVAVRFHQRVAGGSPVGCCNPSHMMHTCCACHNHSKMKVMSMPQHGSKWFDTNCWFLQLLFSLYWHLPQNPESEVTLFDEASWKGSDKKCE